MTAVFLWLGAVPASAQEATGGSEPMVRSVHVEGNKRVNTSTILFYVKSQINQPLSRSQVRRDIEQIYSLGQFKDIQVDTRPVDGGVDLVYKVVEIPSVGLLKIVGNDKIDTKEIIEKVNIKRGAAFNDHLVQETIETINALYHDKGFFFVVVNVETEQAGDSLVDVYVRVNEGKKVNIEKVRFSGNKSFTDKELRKTMETREKTFYSFIDESGIYKKDQLKLDLLRVESFYHDHGFMRVRVLEPQIEINKKDKEIYITVPVEEGAQFHVGKMALHGETALTPEELKATVKSKEKEVYNESQVREDVLALTELFSKKGHAYADVNPNVKINDDSKTVDLTLEIDKGKKVYVGEITVNGNARTRDNVIRREFRMKEGELFDSDKLKRSKQRITNLNFFQDVKLDTQRGKTPDLIDIHTTVTERPTGNFMVGAGFSSLENLILNASISQNNLFGRGQKLVFGVDYSSRRRNFNLSFTDPRLLDTDILGGADIFKRRSNFFSFLTESEGFGLRLGKSVGEYDWAGLQYRFDHITVSDVTPENESTFLYNGTRITSRIVPSFIHDTRDDFLNPTKGWRHLVRFEYAGGPLGGSDFYKSGYEVTYYHPLIEKLVGAIHSEVNVGNPYNNDKFPLFERYFMGGPTSLRGYTIRNIGPRTIAGDPIGGDRSILFNMELQYPFTKGFRGFVFFDRGNVYGEGANLTTTTRNFDLSIMRQSIGAGIRFMSPFGPIGVAYGIKLDRQQGEKIGEFHFSAGNAF